MGMIKLENVRVQDLPKDWASRFGLDADTVVTITIEETERHPRSRDLSKVEAVLDRIAGLRVHDDREPDDILNYDAAGLPR